MKEKTIVAKNEQEIESIKRAIREVCLECAVSALCNSQIEETADKFVVVKGENGFINSNLCGI